MKKYSVILLAVCLFLGSLSVFAAEDDQSLTINPFGDDTVITTVSDENLSSVEGEIFEDGVEPLGVEGWEPPKDPEEPTSFPGAPGDPSEFTSEDI